MLFKFYNKLSNYASLVKISHTVFALPFAIIGFFLGLENLHSPFDSRKFLLILLCVFFARNSAMSFNRIVDRKFDKLNPRTQERDIPSGKIPVKNAVVFLVLNIMGFILATFFINRLCFFLSPVALIVILGYSFTKRFTFLAHFVLGLGLSLAPIGAYLAVTGRFDFVPLLLSFAVLFWVGGFDIIYALGDISFDRKLKLHSIPQRFGITNALLISGIIHLFAISFIIMAGMYNNCGLFYWIGAGIFGTLLLHQHIMVKPTNLKRINLAFFTLNGISSIVLLIFFLLDYYIPL
ncbi:MAG: UbiA-like polyprenyltransferase [Bacteroidota bacterium]